MSRRTEQLGSLLQERIGVYLTEHLELPEGGLVTVTRVLVDPDIRHARVYVGILPDDKRGSILAALKQQVPDLHEYLLGELALPVIPRIKFLFDDMEAKANEIERLLDSL